MTIQFDNKRVSRLVQSLSCYKFTSYWYLIESHELLGMHFVPWAYNIHLSVFKPLWFHFSYTQQAVVYQLPTSETYENQSGLGLLCDVWLRIYNSWTLIKALSSQ